MRRKRILGDGRETKSDEDVGSQQADDVDR